MSDIFKFEQKSGLKTNYGIVDSISFVN